MNDKSAFQQEVDGIPWLEELRLTEVPDAILPELQLIHSDIPTEMLKSFVRKAARRFAERSRTQLRYITLDLQDCVTDYPVKIPDDEKFISFQRRTRTMVPASGARTECGRYWVSWVVPSCTIRVEPKPTCSEPVKVLVATAPSPTSCLVDHKLLTDNWDTILEGAKAYLYSLSGEHVDFANPGLAQYHEQKFTAGITSAGIDKITGRSAGPFKRVTRRIV